jgi:hypothetical protein
LDDKDKVGCDEEQYMKLSMEGVDRILEILWEDREEWRILV